MKNIRILVITLAVTFYAGCASQPVRRTSVPNRQVTPPTEIWDNFSEIKNTVFEVVDIDITPLDAHKAQVSGKISNCGYDVISGQCRWVPRGRWKTKRVVRKSPITYERKTYNKKEYVINGKKRITQNESTQHKSWMPQSVVLKNPFGKDVIGSVDADGYFSATLIVEDKYFLTKSSLRTARKSKYFDSYHHKEPKNISIRPHHPPSGAKFDSSHISFPVNYLEPNSEDIRKYIRKQITKVKIDVRDKITHLPVSPDITITGSQVPSKEELKNRFIAEFGDEDLANNAMKQLWRHLGQDDVKKSNAQSIDFTALVGATYKIETMHGKYYYFCGFIEPTKTPQENKSILLIEKGGKVRVENVKEGEGGIMVDSSD